MSEVARTSNALALTEKNTQRPNGGCVGIFFQLFDWNRRFSKKKFFPKKLLPPARTKVSKKFNADEKLPVGKHLLIAVDENNGGFPGKVKKNGDLRRTSIESKKHELRAPGLVARLMGLEAMPVGEQENAKSNKSFSNGDCKGQSGGGSDKMDLSPEKGSLRPQKIQRTGVLERRPVTRFGAEALHIKNVLSRSRKHHHHHHHPKLASPVKSPKLGRNTSRLIDAAARILEPGMQGRSRARCSLTYTDAMVQPCKEDVIKPCKGDMDLPRQFSSQLGVNNSLNAQGSCRSCGNLTERKDVRSTAEEQTMRFDVPASNFREAFFRGVEDSRPRPAVYLENETNVVLLKTRFKPDCVTDRTEESRPVQNEMIRSPMNETQCHNQMPASRMFTSQKNGSSSFMTKHRLQRHGQMLVGDRVPPRSKVVNTHGRRVPPPVNGVAETKDFIALNRNISRTRVRMPSKSDNVEPDRRFCAGKNDSVTAQRSPVRKKRTLNANRQAESSGSASVLLDKQRSNKDNVSTGNAPKIRGNSVNQSYVKSRPASQRSSKKTDVVSFTFSSPIKSSVGTLSPNEMDVKRIDETGPVADNHLHNVLREENATEKLSQNSLRISGDALGALLEQKLKELTCQAENEAVTGFMPSSRTTASILQELITALTAERPVSCEDGANEPDTKFSQSGGDGVEGVSEAKSRIKRSSDGFSRGVDHFSPGGVLDASFSNESCISSSVDDSSGHVMQPDCMDLSCDTVQPACTDADLSDSASSANKHRSSDLKAVTDLRNHTSAVLQNVKIVHARLTGTKLDYVLEILLNAELLFSTAGLHSTSRLVDFLLGPLLDELETLVIAAWKNTVILGLEVRKEESPLRRFIFECIIECLDVRYSRYSNFGRRAWSRLPKSVNADVLIKVFDEEVRKWISLSGKAPDEIIEKEMSTSLGKWTDFEVEAFETGSQITQDIVQTLVDEIVIDLTGSGLSYC